MKTKEYKWVAAKTFTSDLVLQGSWGSRDLGKHESTMVFSLSAPRGHIEWDVPTLETTEEIGLTFEYNEEGALVLTDYDGIMSLPKEAIELLREQNIIVTEDFE